MRRRQALLAGGAALASACLGPGTSRPQVAEAASQAHVPDLLAWTADGAWVVPATEDAGAQPAIGTPWLAAKDSQAPRVAPAVARGGIWIAGGDGEIGFWPCAAGAGLAPAPVHRQRLPAPADALGCTSDTRWAIAGAGGDLHLVDRNGTDSLVRRGLGREGEALGRVRTITELPHRRSVLVDWDAGREWWELSLDPDAAPVFDGLVHDYRMGEAIGRTGYRYPRRILPVETGNAPAPRLVAAPRGQPWVLGHDGATLSVVHLDVRRTIFRQAAKQIHEKCLLTFADAASSGRLWVAADDQLLVFTPPRWAAPAVHLLPGSLRSVALSPRGDALWALSGANGEVRLFERPLDAETTHGWRRAKLDSGNWVGFACRDDRALAALAQGQRRDDADVRIAWFAADGSILRRRDVRLHGALLGATTLDC